MIPNQRPQPSQIRLSNQKKLILPKLVLEKEGVDRLIAFLMLIAFLGHM